MGSIPNLDTTDHEILWHLDLDGRLSLTELAHRVGLSKQGINYRLKKLTESGVIRGFYALINPHRLGLLTYRLYLRLKSTSPAKTAKFVRLLVDHPNTLWIGSLTGSWDLEVVFVARNFIHFSNMLKDLHEPLGDVVHRSNISMTPAVYALRRDYLKTPIRKGPITPGYGNEPDGTEWDELDFGILGVLATDGRVTYDDLAKQFDVTNHTAKSRILKLEKAKVITAFRADIDTSLFGRQYVKALLSLAPMSAKEERALYAACVKNSSVVWMAEVLGTWQLELDAEVTTAGEMDTIIRNLRASFPSLITDYDTVAVATLHKINFLPPGGAAREILRKK